MINRKKNRIKILNIIYIFLLIALIFTNIKILSIDNDNFNEENLKIFGLKVELFQPIYGKTSDVEVCYAFECSYLGNETCAVVQHGGKNLICLWIVVYG